MAEPPLRSSEAPLASGRALSLPILILVCADVRQEHRWLDIPRLAQWLGAALENALLAVAESLCQRPAAQSEAMRRAGAQRLVLGLCSTRYAQLELEAQLRQAGLDPFGVPVVNLGDCAADSPSAAVARAELLLAAAVARARAFGGARPENRKAVLLAGQRVVGRRALFTLPPVSYVAAPTINADACRVAHGCDLCLSACPAAALTSSGHAIEVDRARCQACGLCVAACPQRAVEFPGYSATEIEAQVDALLYTAGEQRERALVFTCRSAQETAPGPWLPVQVACAAMVPVAALLYPLAHGAAAVALAPCGPACAGQSDPLIQGRVDYCRQLLTLLGEEPERVRPFDRPFDGAQDKLRTPLLPPGGGAPPLHHATSPLGQEGPPSPARLFGQGAAGRALARLAALYPQAQGVVLEHPLSPVGLVQINTAACTACGSCVAACPSGALQLQTQDAAVAITFDPLRCTGCGKCVALCPEQASGAIHLAQVTDLPLLAGGPRIILRGEQALCERCGAPVASLGVVERVAALLGEDFQPQVMGRLCSDCRGLPF
ncbi:MAG: 4Fe-4S binding protein [Chloroflexi bacterium]|nr:4Fe-4S binding protein [Chloroflexota bacterium]